MTFLLQSCLLAGLAAGSLLAQELEPDARTTLLLHFNLSLQGADGEWPVHDEGLDYVAGRHGQALRVDGDDRLRYLAAGNLAGEAGTVEAWLRPDWGGDGEDHWLLAWGGCGGMLVGKDGGDYLRILLNRWSCGGQPEIGAGTHVGGWTPGDWHHAAFSWSPDGIRVYVDGGLAAQGAATVAPPPVADAEFEIGGQWGGAQFWGAIDELRISDVAREAAEIAADYVRGLTLLSLEADPATLELWPTWNATPTLSAQTDLGERPVPASLAAWTSSNPAVASVDGDGRITALAAGSATVTGVLQGFSVPVAVTVRQPARPPLVEELDPFLTAPAESAVYEMPVAILSYLPTLDGLQLDAETAGWSTTLDQARAEIVQKEIRVKFALEEGSRFRGFDDPDAPPSLGYRVVAKITVFEPLPPGPGTPESHQPDYRQLLERFDAGHWVNELGVKEVWVWGYHHGALHPVESNMASPTTGDVSNSWRIDDLPVYERTYVLYNYNYTRSQAEAVHNHGHQLESILSHAAWLQDGNADLFWRRFSGQDADGQAILGRCGNTHIPPNTTAHYDYLNPATVASDIRAWQPAGGPTTPVSYHTWGDHPYAWPYGEWAFGQREETQWYIFWMQSMPGFGGAVPWGATTMTNWWVFTADWDAAITAGLGLYGAPDAATPQLAATVESGGVRLAWSAEPVPPAGYTYLVHAAPEPDGPWSLVARTTATTWLYAAPGARGFYRVVASYPATR